MRGSLRWTPTDTLEINLKAETGYYDVTGRMVQVSNLNGVFQVPAFGINQPLVDLADPREDGKVDDEKTADAFDRESTDTDNDNIVLTADWDFGEFTLTSITGYSSYNFYELSDVDFTDLRFIQQDIEQYSQEIRLTSPLAG